MRKLTIRAEGSGGAITETKRHVISPEGRMKGMSVEARCQAAATRLGMPLDEYRWHREHGEHWCSWHREWHSVAAFYRRSAGSDKPQQACKAAWREYREHRRRAERSVNGR